MATLIHPHGTAVYGLFDTRSKRIFAVRPPHLKTCQVLFVQKTDAFRMGLALEESLVTTGALPFADLELSPESMSAIPASKAKRHNLTVLAIYAFDSLQVACERAERNHFDVVVVTDMRRNSRGCYDYSTHTIMTQDNFGAWRSLAYNCYRGSDAFN